jgi:hypothetical protein
MKSVGEFLGKVSLLQRETQEKKETVSFLLMETILLVYHFCYPTRFTNLLSLLLSFSYHHHQFPIAPQANTNYLLSLIPHCQALQK